MCYSTIDEQGQPRLAACLSGAFCPCPSMVRASQCTEIDSGMKKRHFTEKEKKLIGWAAIVIFVVFTAAVCWFVGRPMGKFVSEPEKFRLWVESHGLWSQAAYVGMVFCRCWWPSSPASRWRSAADTPSAPYRVRCCVCWGPFWAAWWYSPSCAGSAGSWWRFFSPRRRSSPCVFAELP